MQTFTEKARIYWTSERVKKITGGKKLLLTPDLAPDLLRVMSLLNSDASMSASNVRKFRQINHILALLSEDLKKLSTQHSTVRILDIGCGNSYLSILLTWYFKDILKHPVECVGIDPNTKVIAASAERAKTLNYHNELKFIVGDIKDFTWKQICEHTFPSEKETRPHAVLALHACDTATDYALAFAIQNKTDCIAVAPCCQAELARQWKSLVESDHALAPIYRSHHFRREIAADMTDVMRMLLVRSKGYEVTATEFVAQEDSAKNRLLTCIRRGSSLPDAKVQFEKLKTELGGTSIVLENLINT